MGYNQIPGLVNVYIAMENHHFLEVNHLFLWAMFNCYVSSPEGTRPGKHTKSYGIDGP